MSLPNHAMAPAPPAGNASDEDYEALLSVLSDTARGRAFLAEHARRARHADTAVLLAAIERLEALIRARGGQPLPAASMQDDDVREPTGDRQRPGDPLAALMALTEDERLALFT